jgi:hypothetical protein
MKKSGTIEIQSHRYAFGFTMWNVWRNGKIIYRGTTKELAERFVTNRWFKISEEDAFCVAKSLTDVLLSGDETDEYERRMNAKVAEIEARERPH